MRQGGSEGRWGGAGGDGVVSRVEVVRVRKNHGICEGDQAPKPPRTAYTESGFIEAEHKIGWCNRLG